MGTPTIKQKLAAFDKTKCEGHPRRHLAQNTNIPRSQEDYITKIADEIEGTVRKKLYQEFNKTENCLLGALFRLDEFHLSPLLQAHSGSSPETSQNALGTNQGTNEDDSQKDPHPEARVFQSQTM